TLAATITLYAVKPSNSATGPTVSVPKPSLAIHAIGTGANGETTYVQDTVQSVFVDEIAPLNGGFYTTNGLVTTSTVSTETTTYTSGPLTYHATLIQDATHYVYHQEPNTPTDPLQNVGFHNECKFDGKGSGSCVEEYWMGDPDAGTTTTSWTGSMVPIYTLTAADGPTKTANPNGAMPGPSFVRESCLGWRVFLVGAMSAWVFLL
ncbi:hypothetical protein C0992_003689, partial [Termitomyces sp. T32_za158]